MLKWVIFLNAPVVIALKFMPISSSISPSILTSKASSTSISSSISSSTSTSSSTSILKNKHKKAPQQLCAERPSQKPI